MGWACRGWWQVLVSNRYEEGGRRCCKPQRKWEKEKE